MFSQTNFRRACREQARLNLLPFTTYTKPDYVTNWHHEELARKLDEVAARHEWWEGLPIRLNLRLVASYFPMTPEQWKNLNDR